MHAAEGTQEHAAEIDLTILFSDVVASTELIGRRGDHEWRSILDTHCRILETVAAGHGGTVVKCSGDGFMLTFEDPCSGVQCALRLQTAFRVQNQLAIRIGVHHGPVIPYRGDYVGLTVHLAARYTDLGSGGEVVMSEHCFCAATAGAALPEFEKRMEFVKGVDLPQPVRIARPAETGSLL